MDWAGGSLIKVASALIHNERLLLVLQSLGSSFLVVSIFFWTVFLVASSVSFLRCEP